MTNQDYVTYPTAKLLKEAGYLQETSLWSYRADGKMTCTDNGSGCCDAPHLWDAMKWLRHEKKLVVEVYIWPFGYSAGFSKLDNPTHNLHKTAIEAETYEQACDAVIAAACEWLINKTNKQ